MDAAACRRPTMVAITGDRGGVGVWADFPLDLIHRLSRVRRRPFGAGDLGCRILERRARRSHPYECLPGNPFGGRRPSDRAGRGIDVAQGRQSHRHPLHHHVDRDSRRPASRIHLRSRAGQHSPGSEGTSDRERAAARSRCRRPEDEGVSSLGGRIRRPLPSASCAQEPAAGSRRDPRLPLPGCRNEPTRDQDPDGRRLRGDATDAAVAASAEGGIPNVHRRQYD